jgi:hypothetical protein
LALSCRQNNRTHCSSPDLSEQVVSSRLHADYLLDILGFIKDLWESWTCTIGVWMTTTGLAT